MNDETLEYVATLNIGGALALFALRLSARIGGASLDSVLFAASMLGFTLLAISVVLIVTVEGVYG